MTLAAGTRLGSYEILAPLGVGGMGEVYRARDSKLHREVALKVIPSRVDSDLATLDRFQREARTAAALNHPHIVTIYAVEEFDGRVFLAMEFVDGHTLADLIPSDGLPIDTLLKHAIPLADALSAAHAHANHAPRSQAVECDGDERWPGEGARLRAGEAARAGGPAGRHFRAHAGVDGRGSHRRNGRVYVARAGGRRRRRRAERSLFARGD